MGKRKTDEWKTRAQELIKSGQDYKSTNETLLQEHKLGIGGSTFRRFKAAIFPEEMRERALSSMKEKRSSKKPEMSRKVWTKVKQTEADLSPFAGVINQAMFSFIPCPNKNLTIEQVNEINLGGSIVGVISYYTNVNLNHPLLILLTRVLLLVIKVRAMCFRVQERVSEIQSKVEGLRKGVLTSSPLTKLGAQK